MCYQGTRVTALYTRKCKYMAWIKTCTLLFAFVYSLPCLIRGLTFTQCTGPTNYSIELTEGVSGQNITCDGTGQSGRVSWFLSSDILLNVCPFPNSACYDDFSFSLATRDSTSSTTTWNQSVSRFLGTYEIICQESSNTVACPLDVIYQSEVTCDAQYNTDGPKWTVSGRCTITKALSTRGRYACLWFYKHDGLQALEIPSSQTIQSLPVQTPGSNTTHPYYSFTCNFSMPFPTVVGTYSYKATVYPGNVQLTATFSGSSNVVDPTTPSHSCPRGYTKEGTTLTCTCTTTNPGNPPATLAWKGQTGPQLSLANVTSSLDNLQYTCEVRRGATVVRNTTYTMHVAYGPKNVSVSGPSLPFDTDGTRVMTLQCTASGYQPSVSFSWRRGSSSSVISTNTSYSFPADAQDDGVKVTCTAANSQYSDIQATSAFYTLDINYPPTSAPAIASYNDNDILYAGDNLTLVCTVRGGKPLVTRVLFSCDGKQDGSDVMELDGVSSSVYFTPLVTDDDGVNCTCRAEWKTSGWYTLTATTRLTVYCAKTYDKNDADGGPGFGAGVGVGLVVGMACIVGVEAVILVLWRRRAKLFKNKGSTTPPATSMTSSGTITKLKEETMEPADCSESGTTGPYELLRLGEVGQRSLYEDLQTQTAGAVRVGRKGKGTGAYEIP